MDEQVATLADSMDIPQVLRLAQFSPEDYGRAKGRAMLMAGDIIGRSVGGDLSLGELPSLNGLGLAGWLPTVFYETATPAIMRTSACQVLHEKEGVAGVLVHEDVTPNGRVLAQWGNANGVPTMHLPHANHFSKANTGDIHCQATAKNIGAAGSHMERWYSHTGANITKVGVPWWDAHYKEAVPSKDMARHALGVKDGEYVLGYATTWAQMTSVWGGDPEPFLTGALHRVFEAVKKLNAFLLLKMHPGEHPEQDKFYEQEMKDAGIRGAVTRHHAEVCLRAMDCLVTQGPSNLGVSAQILGTPVVEMFVHGARYTDGPKGTWGDGLEEMIAEAVLLPEWTESMNYMNDGKATERTLDWIRGCLTQ
jgi:hypothetical protein